MSQTNFYSLTLPELEKVLSGLGKEKFRARQVFKWVYEKGVADFSQMTDLAKDFRAELPALLSFHLPELADRKISVDGTEKYLFRMKDGELIESVLIPNEDRLTLCISSEVGCNFACKFCFTAKQKLRRRLDPGEIVGQYLVVAKLIAPERSISNIVFMGMGEPLDNPEAVFKAVEVFHNPLGVNFSRRKITISTSGLADRIPLVTKSRVRLAVSLNATTDELRDKLMPINRKYPLAELMEACRLHARESKDKVTIGYVLMKGVTDSLDDARRLYKLTRPVPCKINIIPFNEHPESGFMRPDEAQVIAFQKELMRLGAHVLLRKTMGRDIYAACGQLTSVQKKTDQDNLNL